MNKLFLLPFLFLFCGCVTQGTVTIDRAVLLPEDRIFTLPAGQKVDVMLDNKTISNMTFPIDMKIVSATVLIRQEEKLNNALYDKIKANKSKATNTGIFGGIIALLGSAFVFLNNMKKQEKKS